MDLSKYTSFKELPKSYWIASTENTNYPAFSQDMKIDVVIIGGGLVGIQCAYF